ncbi:Mitochondrial proton/calcium exchanger protein [Linum perenne]
MRLGMKMGLRDGAETSFWLDRWIDGGDRLIDLVSGSIADIDVHQPVNAFVSATGEWNWPLFDQFLSRDGCLQKKVSSVSSDEILSFAKLFNDEIISAEQAPISKYMGISPFGTDSYLRFMLRKRLQSIKKADDKMIQEEGIETLTEDELRAECRETMNCQLLTLELGVVLHQYFVTPNILILLHFANICRAFTVSGRVRPEEAVLASTGLPSEDAVSERRRKLELLQMEDERIKCSTFQSSNPCVHLATREGTLEKQEELCELSRALAVLASASIKLYNSMIDSQGIEDEKAAMKAYRAAKDESVEKEKEEEEEVSSALIDRVPCSTIFHSQASNDFVQVLVC